MPVREFDCLRLGTAMGTPVDQTGDYRVLKNPPAYDEGLRSVKSEGLGLGFPLRGGRGLRYFQATAANVEVVDGTRGGLDVGARGKSVANKSALTL